MKQWQVIFQLCSMHDLYKKHNVDKNNRCIGCGMPVDPNSGLASMNTASLELFKDLSPSQTIALVHKFGYSINATMYEHLNVEHNLLQYLREQGDPNVISIMYMKTGDDRLADIMDTKQDSFISMKIRTLREDK